MTLHVIDPNRPLPPTHGDQEHALPLGDDDTVFQSAGTSIAAYGNNANAIFSRGRASLFLDGEVYSATSVGIQIGQGTIHIGQTGRVTGEMGIGVTLYDSSYGAGTTTILNAGTVRGGDFGGITLNGGSNTIVNLGEISGGFGIVDYGAFATDRFELNNTGLIRGSGGEALTGSFYGTNVISNKGKIDGHIFLGHGNDIYDGRGGLVSGLIHVQAGNDVVYGGDGSETVMIGFMESAQGGFGDKFIDGGGGIDRVNFNAFDAPLTLDLRITGRQPLGDQRSWVTLRNVEEIVGGRGADQITGNDAANMLAGVTGNDLLRGEGGEDRLIGWAGNDTLVGGAGTDVAVFQGNFADYRITRNADGSFTMTDTPSSARVNDNTDTLIGVEYAEFKDRAIALQGTTNSAPTSISLSGRLVDGDAPVGTLVATLSGVDPDGDALGYSLVSNPGNHFRIHGDRLLVDRAFTDRDADITITVRASDPHGASIDRTFVIEVDPDVISIDPIEMQPSDVVSIPIEEYPEMVYEPASVASLILTGGKKADVLKGGAGDDLLNGGLGIDTLTGGSGADVFAFSTKLGKTNVDVVTDFSEGDTVQLSKAVFGKLGKGVLKDGSLRFGKTALDKDDRILIDRRSGDAYYDADGSGTKYAAVKFATFKKAHLDAGDFLIV